jgi:hypothetical protein
MTKGRRATRILVALEDEYRAYREMIAAGIEVLRPYAEVTASGVGARRKASSLRPVGGDLEHAYERRPERQYCMDRALSRPHPADEGAHCWARIGAG